MLIVYVIIAMFALRFLAFVIDELHGTNREFDRLREMSDDMVRNIK